MLFKEHVSAGLMPTFLFKLSLGVPCAMYKHTALLSTCGKKLGEPLIIMCMHT